MRRCLTLPTLTLVCVSLSGLALASDLSCRSTSESLARAISENDRGRALELVRIVLQDEASEEYRFGYEARWNAANAVRDLRLVEAIPLLRKVAGLDYYPPSRPLTEPEASERDLLKILAIKSALSALTQFSDSDAVLLNRLHISSRAIASTAIRNLKELEGWEATEEIRALIQEREPSPEAILDLTAGLDFLAASPRSRLADCAAVTRLAATYRRCFDFASRPAGVAGCEDFVRAAKAVQARLRCPAEAETPRMAPTDSSPQ